MNQAFGKRVVGRPAKPGRRLLNNMLHHVECGVAGRGKADLRHRPVFIIGAPRCGSTLLYQVMLEHFDFGYLSNFHCLFYGAPSLVERLVRPSKWKTPSNFASEHGAVAGWNAPSECGEFWYRFFHRRPQFVTLDETDERSMRNLRVAMRAIIRAMGRPILFKNLLSALRLRPIAHALPESLFVVVQRDWLETAHSILEARRKLYGNYDDWFSVEPPGIEEFRKMPTHEQPVEQIRSIHRLIDEARSYIDPKQFIDVDYGDLCRDTYATLNGLVEFFETAGLSVARGGDVPPSFKIKGGVRIDQDLYEKTKEYLKANPRS